MNDKEKVLIVGINLKGNENIKNYIEELRELVEAANGEVISQIIQKRDKIDPGYFIGRGKAQEIYNYCESLDIDTVVFNDELSGIQTRNLEDIIHRKIIDRTNLILDIFAKRASTKEGKLQVKLAQLQYRLPRLIGMRDYLSREGGGIGTRGPGEKKLETDRRHILRKVNDIKKQLKNVQKNREIKRKKRIKSNLPIVALVGYTNAGKSTLLNKIVKLNNNCYSKKDVFVYDMLFATLDTSFRKAVLPNGQDFLIIDTVGFVSNLPTHLIEAFKSTLEEVKYADLILHIIDASNKDLDIQINTTESILKELNVLDKPIINVFNKIDKISKDDIIYNDIDKKVFISAKQNLNLTKLLELIQQNLPQKYQRVKLYIPYEEQYILSNIYDDYKIYNKKYTKEGIIATTDLNSIDYNKYYKYIIK